MFKEPDLPSKLSPTASLNVMRNFAYDVQDEAMLQVPG